MGGWVKGVMGFKEHTHAMSTGGGLYGSIESLYFTIETNITLDYKINWNISKS